MINVTVKLFGPARDAVGRDTLEYCVSEPATLNAVVALLFAKYSKLAAAAKSLRFAVNQEYADADVALTDGDEIAVIPPVAGGATSIELSAKRIEMARLIAAVTDPSCGGLVTFEGVVRHEGSPDNPLAALDYSAYEVMALQQMERLRDEAMARFAIHDVAIAHRIGTLTIGETSVGIAVSAAHRGDAFEACRWIIDTLKRDVPIWKKEIWSKGEATWVPS